MPHVLGHIENDFLRKGKPFSKFVGALHSHYNGEKSVKNWEGNLIPIPKGRVDWPILFFNDKKTSLLYGQSIVFLPYLIGSITLENGNLKWLVVAKNIKSRTDHEANEIKTAAFTKEEEDYEDTESYKIIYCGGKLSNKAKVKKETEQQRSDRAIEWLIENAVSFDDMNLATN